MDSSKFQYPRGSEWRKWDLHVHTPASFFWRGGKTLKEMTEHEKDQSMKAFIKTVNDSDVAAFCVMDYWTFDWCHALRKYVQANPGELQKTVFNGMELRVECPVDYRLNIHVILSNELTEQQLNDFRSELKIRIGRTTKNLSEEALINFARSLDKDKAKVHGYGDPATLTDDVLLKLGSQTAEVTKDSLLDAFKHLPEDSGFILLPYDTSDGLLNLDWSRHPQADNFFMQSATIFESRDQRNIDLFNGRRTDENKSFFENFYKTIGEQPKPCVSGSDAHAFKDYGNFPSDRITWIKADPTFEGLKQVIYEPADRVFIGKEPHVIDRVRSNKTKYIRGLKMNQRSGYDGKNGVWFSGVDIDFNSELVAIIGNKGSGKSAISDVVGLLGHTKNAGESQKNLSFLNQKKFKKKGYAENFEAQLLWEDESCVVNQVPLNQAIDLTEIEKVRYLPQSYFESLTNELELNGFDQTLKGVTFLHIPVEDRLGFATFEELEKAKSKNVETDLLVLKDELRLISEEIIKLEKKKHPDHRKSIQNAINEKENELSEHEKNKPKEVKDPALDRSGESDPAKQKKYSELADLNSKCQQLDLSIDEVQTRLKKLTKEKEDLTTIHGELARFESQISTYKIKNRSPFEKFGLDIDQVVKTDFDLTTVSALLDERGVKIAACHSELRTTQSIDIDEALADDEKDALRKGSFVVQREEYQKQIDAIKLDLSKPEKDFQEYKERLAAWEAKKKDIEGTNETPKSLNYLKNQASYLDTLLVPDLEKLRSDRLDKAVEIFRKKKEVVNLYNSFKESIDSQLAQDKEFAAKFKMEIEAGFRLAGNFASKFLTYIHKAKSGSFTRAEEKQVRELFEDKNLLNEDDVKSILQNIIVALEEDQRAEVKDAEKTRQITDQINDLQEFYDFVFSLDYLEPIYELKLDEKTLDELSPGEKGALLLVFYLIIDKEDIPLIIDQPEDNLDNKSVFQVLTHFIRAAKKRRQIIIVTHNPNLAVGADAEQIIYVELDKKDNHRFNYELGSIEHPEINNRIVEILEGTMPAFDNRKLKYRKIT
jgi:ABC-type lipoprotein export system ATPase subunit/glutaredoxin 2